MINLILRFYRLKAIHRFFAPLAQWYKVWLCAHRYQETLGRIRQKVSRGEKIQVVFLADDPSKWKYQTIYELMSKSERYDPIVALGLRKNHDNMLSVEELEKKRLVDRSFYERKGCKCVLACDFSKKKLVSIKDLCADILFYQEPWMLFGDHDVFKSSKWALTSYVPYSVEWEIDADLHWLPAFHCLLFANFVWNGAQAMSERPKYCAGFYCEVGHPSLDRYYLEPKVGEGEYVIYAPHFAFPYDGKVNREILGTFEWNGKEMLRYAKRHPEIRWVFKPHPALRWQLEEKGFMTRSEVDFYYAQWEQIGKVCYDGDYFDLFRQSRAMITDSCSFLIEYAPTKMPIVRPLAAQFSLHPSAQAKKVFDTYYGVHNWNEMERVLDAVVVRREDEKGIDRRRAIEDANLANSYAAQKVLDRLDMEFFGGKE